MNGKTLNQKVELLRIFKLLRILFNFFYFYFYLTDSFMSKYISFKSLFSTDSKSVFQSENSTKPEINFDSIKINNKLNNWITETL